MNKKDKKRYQTGFTLIEMITAIFVFLILITLVLGGFVQVIRLGRRAQNTQQVEENSFFVLELMAREIRVSKVLNSVNNPNCPNTTPVNKICLDHPVNGSVIYFLSGNEVHRDINGIDTIISSNKVDFTRLDFYPAGVEIGDGLQPRITIVGSVQSKANDEQAILKFQTTVSPRELDS